MHGVRLDSMDERKDRQLERKRIRAKLERTEPTNLLLCRHADCECRLVSFSLRASFALPASPLLAGMRGRTYSTGSRCKLEVECSSMSSNCTSHSTGIFHSFPFTVKQPSEEEVLPRRKGSAYPVFTCFTAPSNSDSLSL